MSDPATAPPEGLGGTARPVSATASPYTHGPTGVTRSAGAGWNGPPVMPGGRPTPPPAPSTRSGPGRGSRVLLGLALLTPAILALLWSYVLPTITTVLRSFERNDALPILRREPGLPAESVGLANYEQLLDRGFLDSIFFALLLGLLPLVFALFVAPVLAVTAHRAGRGARLATRALLALPLAAYAPTAVFLGWRLHRAEPTSFVEQPRLTMVVVVAAFSFGLVVALGTTLYLSALRSRPGARGPAPAMLTVGGFLALGVMALTLQAYTAPQLLTGGGPAQRTVTPVLDITQQSLARMEIGVGSAGSVVLLAILAVLGVAGIALLLLSRARIEFDGWRERADAGAGPGTSGPPDGAPVAPVPTVSNRARPLSAVLVGVALVAFVGILGWSLAPWLRHTFDVGTLPNGVSTGSVLVHTWLPPLVGAIVSVTLAAIGGFGIGALRPLGRWSELLLLPFAPWLFVGVGPLAVDGYLRARDLGQLGSILGLIPPGWVSIPALVAFTLLFRGQQPRWRAHGGLARTMLRPALPMLLVAGLLTWLVNAQQLLWPMLVASRPESRPAPLIAATLGGRPGLAPDGVSGLGLVLPIPLLLLFLVSFVALQLVYLDRLALQVGRSDSWSTPGVGRDRFDPSVQGR